MIIRLKGALVALSIFMGAGIVMSESVYAECKEGEVRKTATGFVFTCDTSHSALGEAWRDRNGLIWGDVVKKDDGSVRYMVQSSEYMKEIGSSLPEGELGAEEYCKSIGARLPSKDEFIRLREWMGARFGTYEGYSAQVLPNLSGYGFWSSWYDAGGAYGFNGRHGSIYHVVHVSSGAVRCVVVGR